MSRKQRAQRQELLLAESAGARPSTARMQRIGGAGLIAAAVLIAYYPSIHGGFILDDDVLLTTSNTIRASDGLFRFWWPWNLALDKQPADYWPLSNTTLWLEWRLWHLDPTGYHVTNLILHIIDSLLVWAVLQRLHVPGAWLAGLLFAVHPVNVESVAWIAQRKDVMAVLFFLLSILFWIKSEPNEELATGGTARGNATQPPSTPDNINHGKGVFGIWYWISILAFVLAMLSKGSVAILPPILLLITWWRWNRIHWSDLLRAGPFFVVAVVLTAINLWFQTHGTGDVIREVSLIQRLLGAGAVIWFYLEKAIFPLHLVFVYPQWHIDPNNPLWWLPDIATATVTFFLLRNRNSSQWKWIRPAIFAWAFFCIALLPVMGFTDVGYMRHSLVADHYQHIALIAVVALVAAAFFRLRELQLPVNQQAFNGVAGLMVVTFAVLTWQQSSGYVDAMTLYTKTVADNPESWLVQHNLGFEYYKAGKLDAAISHYETALRLNPDCAVAYRNLGNALSDLDRLPEAIENYNKALYIAPSDPVAHYNLGMALTLSGHPDQAEPHYRKAIELNPGYPDANHAMGLLLASRGQYQDAIDYFQQTLKADPDFVEADVNMASAYAALGNFVEAIKYAETALELARSKKDAKLADGIMTRLKFYEQRLSNPADNPPNSAAGAAKP
jgi:tetratricopeptide (TPR) repeat protein